MNAQTPYEALAAVRHNRCHLDHAWSEGCCAIGTNELAEARTDLDDLEAAGWLPPRPAIDLPDSVPAGDPRITARRKEDLKPATRAVCNIVEEHLAYGVTSVELNQMYAERSRQSPQLYPQQRYDSPRKRLPELERAGHVVCTDVIREGAHVWIAAAVATARAETQSQAEGVAA